MADDRPPIPENVRRAVRKKCGFGCVLCGDMVCDYHHLVPWAECREHNEDNIVLLCLKHHREITNGVRDEEEILAASEAPFCLREGNGPEYRFATKKSDQQILGTNVLKFMPNTYFPIILRRSDVILGVKFEDGIPLVNMHMKDFSGKSALSIRANLFTALPDSLWDVTFVGTTFKVYYAARNLMCHLEFRKSEVSIVRLYGVFDNLIYKIDEKGILFKHGAGGGSRSFRTNLFDYSQPSEFNAVFSCGFTLWYSNVIIGDDGSESSQLELFSELLSPKVAEELERTSKENSAREEH